ncbi:MAG: diphosphomevalonate/mevalonate 3,5-bisphosphate decarboxylase family protein [Candidatus Limimorpha sp.]
MNERFFVSAVSPSNIAIVKYWGKHGNQLPCNPSVSFTLTNCRTEMRIQVSDGGGIDGCVIRFLFEGKESQKFQSKIERFIEKNKEYFGFLNGLALQIESNNTFPHSSGIASSASSMSALVICLLKIEARLKGGEEYVDLRKASFLSRLASGSASRSVYPVMALWGATPSVPSSSDEYAMPLAEIVAPVFKSYHDTVLIVSNKEKKVSSTVGHSLMNGHPFAEKRYNTAKKNTERLIKALKNSDVDTFIEIAEAEALQLHEMMATSNPPYRLMEEGTEKIIGSVRRFREKTNIPVCFTLDAGPNVHLLYPDECSAQIHGFINDELINYCHENMYIDDIVLNTIE